MELILRDYQKDVCDQIIDCIKKGYKSILVVLPCRSGKTPLATYITKHIFDNSGRVLFQVHRKILLRQTSKMFKNYGIKHGLLSPEFPHTKDKIQIGTIGTVYNRTHKIEEPNIIISDEAHRDKAPTREYILSYFKNSIKIGLTATPVRLSGESLGDVYQVMVQGPSVHDLINKGYLCEFKLYCPPAMVDFSKISCTAGDYNKKELSQKTNTVHVVGDAIEHYQKLIPGKQTCIFCVDINHAKNVAEEYNKNGIMAGYIHSNMPTKKQDIVIQDFVEKKIQVITNVDMITEGYDCPGIEAVQILRKTLSLALHIQICTRGMTPSPGKTHCVILDHVGNNEEHGPIDYDFKWTLSKKRKIVDNIEDLKDLIPPIKTCKKCWFTYYASQINCPMCGNEEYRPPTTVKTIKAELILKRTLNNSVRALVGLNKTQNLNINQLKERLDLFDKNDIPKDSKHYIKVLKRYDTLKAKTAEDIFLVAIKYGYTIHWCINRYMINNRIVSQSQAYKTLKIICNKHGINLKK